MRSTVGLRSPNSVLFLLSLLVHLRSKIFGTLSSVYSYFTEPYSIVVFGALDGGKETLMHLMTNNEAKFVLPTDGNNQRIFRWKNFKIIIWDMFYTNQAYFRYTYPSYLPESPAAAILVIDASDPECFSITRKTFHELCACEQLRETPVLVFANKCDLHGCMTVEKIYEGLDLVSLGKQGRRSAVFRCSATTGFGVEDGMKWLYGQMPQA